MTNNTNSNFYRSVKLNMTRREINEYIPYHRGLDINFYAPEYEDDNNTSIYKKNPDQITWVDVTITASNINPNPLFECNIHDIDEELALMDSKYGILKDHLTHTDNKKLIHNKQSKETLMKHGTITSHPYLEGENDYLKSKMTEVHDVEIPLSEVREFEKHIEKRKAFYKKAKLDYVEKLDNDGQRKAVFKMGYI